MLVLALGIGGSGGKTLPLGKVPLPSPSDDPGTPAKSRDEDPGVMGAGGAKRGNREGPLVSMKFGSA